MPDGKLKRKLMPNPKVKRTGTGYTPGEPVTPEKIQALFGGKPFRKPPTPQQPGVGTALKEVGKGALEWGFKPFQVAQEELVMPSVRELWGLGTKIIPGTQSGEEEYRRAENVPYPYRRKQVEEAYAGAETPPGVKFAMENAPWFAVPGGLARNVAGVARTAPGLLGKAVRPVTEAAAGYEGAMVAPFEAVGAGLRGLAGKAGRKAKLVPGGKPEAVTPEAAAAKEPWQMTREEIEQLASDKYRQLRAEPDWKNLKKVSSPGKYYHVVEPDFEFGQDIVSLSERKGKPMIKGKEDWRQSDYGKRTTRRVSLFDNLPEAFEHQRAYGGKILEINVPQKLHTSEEGYTYVRRIPSEWIGQEVSHKNFIKQALSEGKPVPAEVLKDYPDLAAKVKPPIEVTPAAAAAKEPWQMTRGEAAARPVSGYLVAKKSLKDGGKYELWWSGTRNRVEITTGQLYNTPQQAKLDYVLRSHKQAVGEALSEGKPVPAEVLADYPALAAKVKPPVTESETLKQVRQDITDIFGTMIHSQKQRVMKGKTKSLSEMTEKELDELVKEIRESSPPVVAAKGAKPYTMDIVQPARGVTGETKTFPTRVTPAGDYVVGRQPSQYAAEITYGIYDKQGKLIKGGFDKHSEAVADAVKRSGKPPVSAAEGAAVTPETILAKAQEAVPPPRPPVEPPTREPPPPSPSPKERPGFAGNIRLSKYPEEVAQWIKHEAETNPDVIQAARRGIRPDAEVYADGIRLAEEAGGEAFATKFINNWKAGQTFNSEEITALRAVLRSKTQTVLNLTRGIQAGQNDAARLIKLEVAIREQAVVQEAVYGVTAEAGRALRAFRQEAGEALINSDVAQMERILKAIGGRKKTEDVARKLAALTDLNDPVKVNEFIRSMVKPSFWDYVYEWYYNAILSGPKTHIVNMGSNTLVALLSPLERAVAAGVEKPLSAFQRRQQERFAGEAMADAFGMFQGLKQGVRAALFTLRKGGVKLEQIERWEMKPRAFTGKKGAVINLPSNLLMAEDELGRAVNYRAAIEALAYRQAAKGGFKGKALMNRMAEILQSPSKELVAEAKEVAAARLFQAPPGKFTDSIMQARNSVPGLRLVVPFLRTPANLVKFGMARSPLAIFNPKLWQNLRNKNPEASDQIARWLIGSAVSAGIAVYVAEGNITGAAPRDKAARDRFYREGKQPFAVKIGNQWISYQRIEPLNQLLSQVAAVVEALRTGDKTGGQKAAQAAFSIGENFISQTYMSSISNLIDAISDPERLSERFIGQIAGGFVPYGSALRTVGQMQSPSVRQPKTIPQMVMGNIPGVSSKVPTKLNVFGQPIKRVTYPWLPINVSPEQESVLNDELSRMNINIGFVGTTVKGVKLSPEFQRLYQTVAGQATYQRLNEVVNTPSYQRYSDDIKASIIDDSVEQSRQVGRLVVIYAQRKGMLNAEDALKVSNAYNEILTPYWNVALEVWGQYPVRIKEASDMLAKLDSEEERTYLEKWPSVLKARIAIDEEKERLRLYDEELDILLKRLQ